MHGIHSSIVCVTAEQQAIDTDCVCCVLVFRHAVTEATTHGSTTNVSGMPRRSLYYCYSVGWMPDWGGQSLSFQPDLPQRLTPAQAEILRLK